MYLGHFEEIRETEIEKLKKEEVDEAIRKAKEEAKEIEIERKNEEIERLRIEKEELANAAAASKPTQEEDDLLGECSSCLAYTNPCIQNL